MSEKRYIKNNSIRKHYIMKKITFIKRINYTKSDMTYESIDNIVKVMKTGDLELYDNKYGSYTLKQAIEYIRSLKSHNDMQQWKARLLPAIAYNGTFNEISQNGLINYSDITAMDFDNFKDQNQMNHILQRLKKTPCVYSAFITPSGQGLKALILHDNTEPSKHADLYGQLLAKFNVANRDVSCKDMARRNYMSYDPDLWINPNPVPYHYVPSQNSVQKIYPNTSIPANQPVSGKSIINIIDSALKKKHHEYWIEGNRARCIFALACWFCRWGINLKLSTEYFVTNWECDTMTKKEITGHVTSAYKAEINNFGKYKFDLYSNNQCNPKA